MDSPFIMTMIFAGTLVGCSIQTSSSPVIPVEGEVETLASSEVLNAQLHFVAISTGCTHGDSFALQVDAVDDSDALVTVIRVKPDHCRRMPFFESFSLVLPEFVKSKKVILLNPVKAPKKYRKEMNIS